MQKPKLVACVLFGLTAWFSCFALHAAEMPKIPDTFGDVPISWGAESNGLCAGLTFSVESNQTFISIIIALSSTNKSGGGRYIAPPGQKFSRIELMDSTRNFVAPASTREMIAANLPDMIAVKDLPHTKQSGIFFGQTPMLKEPLFIGPGAPAVLKTFAIHSVYGIKHEGDYVLKIWPAVYAPATNKDFVNRLDLPPVSATIHLLEELPPDKPSAIIFVVYGGVLLICVAGVGWLMGHRRRAVHHVPQANIARS